MKYVFRIPSSWFKKKIPGLLFLFFLFKKSNTSYYPSFLHSMRHLLWFQNPWKKTEQTCVYLAVVDWILKKYFAACKPGFFGEFCNTSCPPGNFGKRCGGRCLPKCSKEFCDPVKGCLFITEKMPITTLPGIKVSLIIWNT